MLTEIPELQEVTVKGKAIEGTLSRLQYVVCGAL